MEESPTFKSRIQAVDILRGIIIVIMGLDHIRDYITPTAFQVEDISATTPLWFLTRWITHFCAPIFVFLAGTGAYLYFIKAGRLKTQQFLLTRGLWILFVELVIIQFALSLGFQGWWLMIFWVIGWSMILLSLFLFLPGKAQVALALILILGHNLLDAIHINAFWWHFLHEQNFGASFAGLPVFVIYPLIPWPAVMLLGFVMGEIVLEKNNSGRIKLLIMGSAGIILFLLLRVVNGYGDAHHWATSSRGAIFTVLDFLKVSKYPPSLQFLAITLGPGIILLGLLSNARGCLADFFSTFGRVPFFFFVVHLFVVQGLSAVYNGIVYGHWKSFQFDPVTAWPASYTPNLWLTYSSWFVLIAIMYFLCRWFANVKKTHNYWWLRYL